MRNKPKELIPLVVLAERLNIHPATARKLYRRGIISGIKFGYRTLRFNFLEVVEQLSKKNITR